MALAVICSFLEVLDGYVLADLGENREELKLLLLNE